MKKRILLVEDDLHLAEGLRLNLELDGYEPVLAASAEDARRHWHRGGIDLILLDVMLPGMNGFDWCRELRSAGARVPILFLTAKSTAQDRVRGLDEGGDDYMTKPFDLAELQARIRGLFRRETWIHESTVPDTLQLGAVRVDLDSWTAHTPTGEVMLKEKEVMILRLLAEHRDEPVPRNVILNRVWGLDVFPTTRTVDNFIVNLRKIIEDDPSHPRHILTVHGIGYRLLIDPPITP